MNVLNVLDIPNEVLEACEIITRWAKRNNHDALRIGWVVYAQDYRDIEALYAPPYGKAGALDELKVKK